MQEAILIYRYFNYKQYMFGVRKYYKDKEDQGSISEMLFNDEGILIYFTHKGRNYQYRNTFYLKSEDSNKDNMKYYDVQEFKEYKQGDRLLEDVSFFLFEEAVKDDIVNVKVLSPEISTIPYVEYYNQTKYQFTIQNENYYLNISEFPNPIISYELATQLYYNNGVLTPYTATGSFYKENFSDNIVALNISNSQKRMYAQLMTRICWRIGWIRKDILEKIAYKDLSSIEDAMRNKIIENIESDYNELGVIDKLIGQLLKDWGFLFIGYVSILASKIFPSTLTEEFLTTYNNNLSNFYNFLEFQDENTLFPKDSEGFPLNKINGVRLTNDTNEIKNVESNRRLIYLLSILPSDSMTLFSPTLRLEILDKLLNCKQIYEDKSKVITAKDILISAVIPGYIFFAEDNTAIFTEKDVLNLISTFNTDYNNSNILLDHLLKVGTYDKNQITKFERLYQLLNDVRTIAGISVDNENNRFELTKALHEIWKKSKYSFFSEPPSGLNENGVNPECYFLNEGQSYYDAVYDVDGNLISGAEPIIEFSPIEKSLGYKQGIDFKPDELDKKIVKVHRYKYDIEFNPNDTREFSDGITQTREKTLFAQYHLYQTISLQGYKIDEDLQNNDPEIELANIPAFLFYYYNDYDKIKNLDATISLIIEITLEVGLFFGTGGASAIANLRHLRHISKLKFINKVGNAYTVSQEAVLAWKGIESASETISMTSGVIYSILNYQATVEDDQFKKKLSYFFMAFAFASIGTSIFSRKKITKLADEILENVPPGSPLPGDIEDFLNIIKNRQTTLINQTTTLINGLNLPAANKQIILNFFNALTDAEKTAFHFDFKNLVATDWSKFTDNALQAWKDLRLANIAEATNLNIITKPQKVEAITQFYGNTALRNILEPLPFGKRWDLLDKYTPMTNTTFQKVTQKPENLNLAITESTLYRTGKDVLNKSDVLTIIESNLSNRAIGVKNIALQDTWEVVKNKFPQNIQCLDQGIPFLNDIYNNALWNLPSNFSNRKLKNLLGRNRLFINTKVYNNNTLLNTIQEMFISGEKQDIDNLLNTIPNSSTITKQTQSYNVIHSSFNFNDFNTFALKAIDDIPQTRLNDTELKYVFHFLENHWQQGNRFVIEMESTLYACTSCQRYMQALKKYGATQGKTIEFTFKAHPDATSTPKLKEKLNQQ